MAGISDREVRALIAKAQTEGRTIAQADGMIPGLTVTASKYGTGSWVLRYSVNGKRKEITIGKYPSWGVADARARAKDLRRSVDDGIDVALKKRMDKLAGSAALSLSELAERYFERAAKELAPHTLKQRRSIHERLVAPHIGQFRATEVTPEHIVEVIRKSAAAGKTLPRYVLIHINQLFQFAVGNAICQVNPCRDIKETAVVGKAVPPKPRTALTQDELSAFLRGLSSIPRPYALAIRLLLLTGVRVGTLTEALISEFDIDAGVWAIPHQRRKNRHHTTGPFMVPLPPEAITWVRELIQIADRSPYLLPVEARRHTDNRNSLSKRTTLADWLDRMRQQSEGAWRRVTPHDLRSTCKTWLSELRVDYETRQRYLDHALEGMDAIYDKADFLSHRLAAASQWLKFMNDVERGIEMAEIINLQSA